MPEHSVLRHGTGLELCCVAPVRRSRIGAVPAASTRTGSLPSRRRVITTCDRPQLLLSPRICVCLMRDGLGRSSSQALPKMSSLSAGSGRPQPVQMCAKSRTLLFEGLRGPSDFRVDAADPSRGTILFEGATVGVGQPHELIDARALRRLGGRGSKTRQDKGRHRVANSDATRATLHSHNTPRDIFHTATAHQTGLRLTRARSASSVRY